MHKVSWIQKSFALLVVTLGLAACQNNKVRDAHTVVVGTIAGPESSLMQTAAQIAKQKFALNVKVIEFSDYNLPNEALSNGSLDANMFQHRPYLNAALQSRGFKLQSIARTFVFPVGIYSKKYKSMSEVKTGDLITVPNDPSNEARALLLLQKSGLITLKTGAGAYATVRDIQTNPKKLNIKEVDAAELPRTLDDVGLSVINTTYALPAGLRADRDALFVENKNSPYANLIVVRTKDRKQLKLQQLVKAFQSQAVLDKAKALFKGQAIAAW